MSKTTENIDFSRGVAYAVAYLLRQDEPSLAHEIWAPSGATLKGVDPYDCEPIKVAKRNGWVTGIARAKEPKPGGRKS